jgi:glycosyltransferase involved in cell wall biosynthesis
LKDNKRILFVVNVDWFFVSHFALVALEAIRKGYEVHILCKITTKKDYLEGLGITVHNIDIPRGGINVVHELIILRQMYVVMRDIFPDVVEFYTIKPVIYGGIVSRLLNIKRKIFYITGLGYVFINRGFVDSLKTGLYKLLYKIAIQGRNVKVIVENSSDKRFVIELDAVDPSKIHLIKGAGVDVYNINYVKERSDIVVVVMASRLLHDKGVLEYVEAAKIIKNKGINAEFVLYGDIDKGNPASLSYDEIRSIKDKGVVKVFGFTNNILNAFLDASIVVLPSYREGFPKVLMEAAACGRAVITTDVPGCRDAIQYNKTGLLCKSRDIPTLSSQLEKLILNSKLRNDMGIKGREMAIKEFDQNKIIKKHFKVVDQ